MKPDLETLRTEIGEYLQTQDFAVFRGYPRLANPATAVYWDSDEYPDYKEFLGIARGLGVRLVVSNHRKLTASIIDEALDRLELLDLIDDEYVDFGRRLRELRVFEGFTCSVELSFEFEGRIYFYSRRSEWYEELLGIVDEIDSFESATDEDFDDFDDDLGPYFSNN